jgi:hypothetical protein
MSRVLAAILTAYGKRGEQNIPAIAEALRAQTRPADWLFVMYEGIPYSVVEGAFSGIRDAVWERVDTPREENGRYAVVPYSLKINRALDAIDERGGCDYIVHVTDDSLPHPEKFAKMTRALDEHPDWGAVYCYQQRNGQVMGDQGVVDDAYAKIDHTQVMHRRTSDRWPLETAHMLLGDANYWRALHRSLGPFYPVPEVLDTVQQTDEGITRSW